MRREVIMCLFLMGFCLISIISISALSVVMHVPEKYTSVRAGERVYFETGIKYPENTQRKDLRFEYIISDMEGTVIAKSTMLKAVETQMSFVDFIVIPEHIDSGLYIIQLKISDYEELKKEASSSFQVIAEDEFKFQIYILILIGTTVLVAILVIINIWISSRRIKPRL